MHSRHDLMKLSNELAIRRNGTYYNVIRRVSRKVDH